MKCAFKNLFPLNLSSTRPDNSSALLFFLSFFSFALRFFLIIEHRDKGFRIERGNMSGESKLSIIKTLRKLPYLYNDVCLLAFLLVSPSDM